MRIGGSQSSRLWVALVLCVAATAASAQDRRVVTGVVTDVSDRPVPSARVQSGKDAATTDDSGRFRIVVSHHDRATFDVTRIGFMPSRFGLAPGGDTSVSILILPSPQQLEKVAVTSTAIDRALEESGFARRLREHEDGTKSGIFITAVDIERRNPARITSVFEDLPGVTVCRKSPVESCGLRGKQLVTRPDGHGMTPCAITVYLDGQRLNSLRDPTEMGDIDAIVLPNSVAGIEYYPSGNRIPAQFQLLNGSCGAVIIWTKRG